jgi:hypothetical protein
MKPHLRPSRELVFAVLLALGLAGANLWGINRDVLGLFHDDGVYAVVAKSLSEGKGYRITSLPTSPPQTKYPFVYSHLLSWIWRINPSFPENIPLLKAVNVGLFFAILVLSYFFYCKNSEKSVTDTCLYVLLVGGNVSVFFFTDFTLSDTLFLALILLALLLHDCPPYKSFCLGPVALISATVALAYLTRQAGGALILAGIIHFSAARRYRELFGYLFVLLVLISPWILWQFSHSTYVPNSPLLHYYVSYESSAFLLLWSNPIQAIHILWGNLRYLIESFELIFLLPALPGLRFLVYPLLAWGVYLSWRKHSAFSSAFIFLYLLLILSWPFHPHRYVLPLIPFLVLFLVMGIQAAEWHSMARVVSPWKKQLIAAFLRLPLVLIIALNLGWISLNLKRSNDHTTRGWYGRQFPYGWSGFVETFIWIKQHTGENDVLATAYDPMYYLYTGRRAVRPWFHKPETYFYPYRSPAVELGDVETIRGELKLLGVRYLIIDPLYGYAEKEAAERLFEELLGSDSTKADLVSVSSDSLHKVYSLR